MKLSQKIYMQTGVASVLLCTTMAVFAYASDTVAIAEEPSVLPVGTEVLEGEDARGEAPLNLPGSDVIFSLSNSSAASEEGSSLEESGAELESVLSSERDGSDGIPESGSPSSSPQSAAVSNSTPSGPPPASEIDGSSAASSQSTPSEPSFASSSAPSSAVSSSSASSAAPESSSAPPSSEPSPAPSSEPPAESSSAQSSAVPTGETVTMLVGGARQEMDVYTALCRVVEAEMGGSYHTEALKAQAVAVYSYIRYENKRGAAASLPMREPTQKTKDAVSAVMGQAVYAGGSVAFTPYHACSAGYTNPADEVWNGSYSYLTRVESAHDPNSANKNVTAVFAPSKVQAGLEKLLGVKLDESDPAGWLTVTSVSDSGYVLKVAVTDADGGVHTVTGRQIRESVLSYSIRSHAFTVSWDGEKFVFVTNGYGHGVGMSQIGAEGYAQDGWSYREILSHYYPGTTVQ